MAVKLQTIKDIRNFLRSELSGLYSTNEIKSLTDSVFSSVLGISKLKVLTEWAEPLSQEKTDRIISICRELKTGKPLQYVTGETLFYDCPIHVRPGVLIPRPETEELVDLVIRENRGFSGKILDIGTGSGCIAVAIASNLREAHVTAVDVSDAALLVAKENALLNHVNISFVRADILKMGNEIPEKQDIIVSNPPYVRNSEKMNMHRNVTGYEPPEALFVPDDDPLIFYRAILEFSVNNLNPAGIVYFEINESMGKPLSQLIDSFDYRSSRIIKDINGKKRIIKAVKNDKQ